MTEDRSRAIGHTLSDAFLECFTYIRENTDIAKIPELKIYTETTTKTNKMRTTATNILALSDSQAKIKFKELFGKHVTNLHRILCHCNEYYNLLSQAKVTKVITKDKFLENFDRVTKQVTTSDLYFHSFSFIIRIQITNMISYCFLL